MKIVIKGECQSTLSFWAETDMKNPRFKLGMLFASIMDDNKTFQVKTFNGKHTCGRSFKNPMANSNWLAKTYLDDFRANPDWPVKAIIERAMKDHQLSFSRDQCYRAKKKSYANC